MLLSLLNSARLRPELLILVLMVMIISMFVIPLPTYLVDFLIALNIVLAILVCSTLTESSVFQRFLRYC